MREAPAIAQHTSASRRGHPSACDPVQRRRVVVLVRSSEAGRLALPELVGFRVAHGSVDDCASAGAASIVLAGHDQWAVEIVESLRRRGVGHPILVLRVSRGSRGVREILDRGADSCVSSDCGPEELASWLRALCRRGPSRWDLGAPELELTDGDRALRIRGTSFRFGPVSFRLIRYLVANQDHWVSQREIIERVLLTHHASDSSVVRVQIHQIRKIMGPYRGCVRRSHQRGCGYMFTLLDLPPSSGAEAAAARPPLSFAI